jgi:hypothetical protein
MSGTFKASAAAMGSGRDALEGAAQGIESSRVELEAAYRRLQQQWQSSEARGRADAEYAKVMEWLHSSVAWARGGAATTSDVDALFARVEASGLA